MKFQSRVTVEADIEMLFFATSRVIWNKSLIMLETENPEISWNRSDIAQEIIDWQVIFANMVGPSDQGLDRELKKMWELINKNPALGFTSTVVAKSVTDFFDLTLVEQTQLRELAKKYETV